MEGRRAAEAASTSGRFVGGLTAGFFLGLIGTGIAYAIADNDGVAIPTTDLALLMGQEPAYVQGYEEAFGERLRARRKSAALTGGLLGTLAIIVVVVGATQ